MTHASGLGSTLTSHMHAPPLSKQVGTTTRSAYLSTADLMGSKGVVLLHAIVVDAAYLGACNNRAASQFRIKSSSLEICDVTSENKV